MRLRNALTCNGNMCGYERLRTHSITHCQPGNASAPLFLLEPTAHQGHIVQHQPVYGLHQHQVIGKPLTAET